DPAARGRHLRARRGSAGRTADRHSHRRGRRAILPDDPAAPAHGGRTMTAVLEAASVTVRIGPKALLHAVSVAIAPGEAVALVGANGAGKSTLLRVLAGEIAPSSGTVALKGRALRSYRPRALALHRAVLSQNVSVAFPFTVADIVRMGAGDAR